MVSWGFSIAAPVSLPPFTIVATSRLRNRADLFSALGIPPASCAQVGDSELIGHAWRKWGEDCPQHLEGDFAFAVWDASQRRLFCARDPLGTCSLFYWHGDGKFVFASDILWVLRTPGVPRTLNRNKVSSLFVPGAQHNRHEETFHQGVLSLPSATSIAVSASGARKHTYWQPKVNESLVPRRADEAFEVLRGLLKESVSRRLEGSSRVGAHLSGGLDSSALVSLGARQLEGEGRRLTAFAAVLDERSRHKGLDEREFMDEFRAWPNVDIQYVTAPGLGPFDTIHEPGSYEATFLRSSRHYLYRAMDQAAQDAGLDTMLEGDGGELGVTSWGTGYYSELFAHLRWPTLVHELNQKRARTGVPAWKALAKDAVTVLFPYRQRTPLVLLAPEFRSESTAERLEEPTWGDHREAQLDVLNIWLRKHMSRGPMDRPPLRFLTPLVDQKVLEFCLSAPGSMKIHNGFSRYLVRGALGGILPEKIRWRTDKKDFSVDYPERFAAQTGKVRDFVAAIRKNDPVRAIADVTKLERLLDANAPPPTRREILVSIPTTIYLICFLRQFAEFRA